MYTVIITNLSTLEISEYRGINAQSSEAAIFRAKMLARASNFLGSSDHFTIEVKEEMA